MEGADGRLFRSFCFSDLPLDLCVVDNIDAPHEANWG
jgi:hypothetical protein